MRNMFLILLIAIGSCRESAKEKETPVAEEKKKAAKVSLTDLKDQPINLEQFKGKTVFINIWATWCRPCIQEIPSIESAQELLGKERVVFLLASSETPDQITEFQKAYNYDLKYVRLVNQEELNVESLPTTYIFNPKGDLVFSETGYRKWDDTSNIQMILKITNQQ